MTRVIYSPRAQADISQIWNYTTERWGLEQADRYLRLIQACIDAAAADPMRGTPCDHIRAGYRKLPVGSHVAFYRIVADHLDIKRILHARMDFVRHL